MVARSRALRRCLLGLAGFLAAGCVNPVTLKVPPLTASMRPDTSRMLVRWNNSVAVAPDPVHGGRSQPGLMGRVYFFGPDMAVPREGDGTLTVELSDPSQRGPDGGPKVLEKWIIQPADFQRMKRPDMIGTGYSLFLPWGTYRPDLRQVHMRTGFQPKAGGPPLYSNSGLLKLGDGVLEARSSTYSTTPGATPSTPTPGATLPVPTPGATPPVPTPLPPPAVPGFPPH